MYSHNHFDTATAPRRSQDTFKTVLKLWLPLEKKGHHQKSAFLLVMQTKNSGSDSRLNPAPTWNHTIPHGTLFQAFSALFLIKTHFSSCLQCFTPSSIARETTQTSTRRSSSNMSWETQLPCTTLCPNRHIHTLVHPHVSWHTVGRLHLPLVSKTLTMLISFPGHVLQHGNLILFSDSEPKDVMTLELPLRQVLYSAVIFIQCFTNMPNTQYAGRPQ